MEYTHGDQIQVPEILPILPLRDVVVFPYLIIPLMVGRQRSIDAIQRAMAGDRLLLLITQKDQEVEDPDDTHLYSVGTVCSIMRMVRQPDNRLRILVQGLSRARVNEIVARDPILTARLTKIEEAEDEVPDITQEALMRTVREQVAKIAELGKGINPDFVGATETVMEPGRLADLVASNVEMKTQDMQVVLETIDPTDRLQFVVNSMTKETELLQVKARITASARDQINEHQHEYFLREQLKAIQSELGAGDARAKEVAELREQVAAAKMPSAVEETATRELDRMESMHADSAESQIVRSYLDWLIHLPWSARTRDRLDIQRAIEILNEDHYGLDEVKERIIEFLSVRKLKPKSKGPILCFAGPPGVGKTSLGRSIARAMGRKFVRISLGGMRDEAEIRGHRRTYIGAMPGRIVQMLKQAGANNPVFMLDEIDKLGSDFRGDPASSLLEILDPEQNNMFSDNYLNVPFDLSRVMFITTANLIDPIPGPLKDRMEVIEIPGYTLAEKMQIAYRYLLPRQIDQNGLKKHHLDVSRKAMELLVTGYTREAGLRNLERTIGKVCRKVARRFAEGKTAKVNITQGNVAKYLGPPRFLDDESDIYEHRIGIATGLAWTQVGGEVLNVEATFVDGKGRLSLTGHLGDIMKESAQAALTYARSRSDVLGLDSTYFANHDLHVHVPAGSIPKDGPSAGITIATAMISALRRMPTRRRLAMTGEVTLRGNVLPIGGVKEKVLAAQRAGYFDVILPFNNKRDIVQIPAPIRRTMKFHFVKTMDEVMDLALEEA
ncbi:MAG TPA: endopeptidase La [bacterium]|nr:endopeptidase La [bacterium]